MPVKCSDLCMSSQTEGQECLSLKYFPLNPLMEALRNVGQSPY